VSQLELANAATAAATVPYYFSELFGWWGKRKGCGISLSIQNQNLSTILKSVKLKSGSAHTLTRN